MYSLAKKPCSQPCPATLLATLPNNFALLSNLAKPSCEQPCRRTKVGGWFDACVSASSTHRCSRAKRGPKPSLHFWMVLAITSSQGVATEQDSTMSLRMPMKSSSTYVHDQRGFWKLACTVMCSITWNLGTWCQLIPRPNSEALEDSTL